MKDFPENCWNDTGIFGDGSCRELEHVIHCSRCPVYSRAGRKHLEQDLPEEYLEEMTSVIAHKKETALVGGLSVLAFRLFGERFALKTTFFQEAAELSTVHTLPLKTNRIFKGIVNINGELLLCISMSNLLGLTFESGQENNPATFERMLVVRRESDRFVFSVSQVLGVHHIDPEELSEVPSTLSRSARSLTRGIFILKGHHTGLLNEELLFTSMARSLNQ